MPLRWGPGPVFVHESIAVTRRWQLYALRSGFVLGLVGALALVWLGMWWDSAEPVGSISIKKLAQAGEYFFYAISTTQLMVVLLVAPAATAGAICLDRARGNLTHMLVTELADGEIVLGKLAARLLPVVALVAATIPVLALSGLLGGIIFEAIVSLTLITLALAIFGCALALAISVRATKTHEVLMAVYGVEAIWILSPLIWEILSSTGVVPPIPEWIAGINPFVLAWAPYAWPSSVSVEWIAEFLAGMMAISIALVAYAVFRLRAEARRGASSKVSRLAAWLGRVNRRLFWWRPGPSLDNDPVLWREWRRSRPSRLAMAVWGLFAALSITGMAAGVVTILDDYESGSEFLMIVNGIYATFALLLVSLFAPTVLAEERVRGSLDVLMTTPLPTDRIVLSKWWGAYRVVPALALLPAISCLLITAAMSGRESLAIPQNGRQPAPLDIVDRIAFVLIPVALLLAQGALVTSIGLALATWIRRVGRAVAVSVTCWAAFSFGWVILIELGAPILVSLGLVTTDDRASAEFIAEVLAAACPFGSQIITFETSSWPPGQSRIAFYVGAIIVLLATIGLALVVLAMALATFNRCAGRVSERPRRAPRPPLPVKLVAAPPVKPSHAVSSRAVGVT
jgi:ABC-type transport system involved in multi-copper enzyme maturation permease subunit